MIHPSPPAGGYNPWGITALSAAVVTGLAVSVIWAAISGSWPFTSDASVESDRSSNASTRPTYVSTSTSTVVSDPSASTRPTHLSTSTSTAVSDPVESARGETEGDGVSSEPDPVQNLQLGLEPGQISIADGEHTTIEVADATPGAYVDIEIAQPSYVDGGICPKLIEGKCNLVYSGGGEADQDGLLAIRFPDSAGVELYSGVYVISIRDRNTGASVTIDLSVN